jgi:signal peptidase I
MTELPANLNEPPSPSLTSRTPRPSRWKRAAVAGLLSLVFPGMGQLYNRQPRKAFSLALITYILDFLMLKTRLLFTFSTMVVTVLGLGLWKLYVASEASYAAAAEKPESAVPMPRLTYPFLAILFFVAVFIPFPDLRSEAGFASFKVPSASMCPTICLGERFVADMNAYKLKPLQRGDLILMKHSSSDALFIKRVIGIAGDTVAPGPGGTILVKGQRFSSPAPCGTDVLPKQNPDPRDYPAFQSTTVPEGSFFVVGDNLANSFDSRLPDFGAVTADMVRGRPLFLYWSPGTSRVGCKLQ